MPYLETFVVGGKVGDPEGLRARAATLLKKHAKAVHVTEWDDEGREVSITKYVALPHCSRQEILRGGTKQDSITWIQQWCDQCIQLKRTETIIQSKSYKCYRFVNFLIRKSIFQTRQRTAHCLEDGFGVSERGTFIV